MSSNLTIVELCSYESTLQHVPPLCSRQVVETHCTGSVGNFETSLNNKVTLIQYICKGYHMIGKYKRILTHTHFGFILELVSILFKCILL